MRSSFAANWRVTGWNPSALTTRSWILPSRGSTPIYGLAPSAWPSSASVAVGGVTRISSRVVGGVGTTAATGASVAAAGCGGRLTSTAIATPIAVPPPAMATIRGQRTRGAGAIGGGVTTIGSGGGGIDAGVGERSTYGSSACDFSTSSSSLCVSSWRAVVTV